MSGSETMTNSNGEGFSISLQKNSVESQMHLPLGSDGTIIYKPLAASPPPPPLYHPSAPDEAVGIHGLNINMHTLNEHPLKRKRGRPRKYGPDGGIPLPLTPPPSSASPLAVPSSHGPASPTSLKKPRGRPPGSSKKHHFHHPLPNSGSASAGVGFTPHVITVQAGEDVSSKIMSFSQNGPRAVCILTANGSISNVTLRQPAMSGGTVTYEGRFEILSLSGSYLLSENGGQRSRTGGLSVSLSGPDGRVLGGGVAGLLTAAAPVQVVVGSFMADGSKEMKPANQIEYPAVTAPPKLAPIRAGTTGASSPPSRGTLSESSGGPGSPFNNSNPQGMTTIQWK